MRYCHDFDVCPCIYRVFLETMYTYIIWYSLERSDRVDEQKTIGNVIHIAMNHGLGVLHCLLRAFEHLLNLAYRLDIQRWDARKSVVDQDGISDKDKLENTKKSHKTRYTIN